ncbi:cbb3-type cytochrome oxidase subunit 3 [Rhodocyclus gracilis]|uniref:CcoQ/FixQ family Cbb3-type cytochrome c oxidase assembly chaperone n=1 Tax=Rhodocyclus tenuis TaxID=1066 RepID=A0A6L5JWN2_RHOTE|nr:cbb3-type cytochrome c oxidase subunit 3 [Rhodocyclus gracilis]MQY51639.1 CcoQ/FixQ family Cbb3-type cytochrome c oxidase assembly chaperone [Rhodocyclus gracilis]
MDINDLRALMTVVSFVTFLGIIWWAFGVKANKARFDEAAQLPFSDEAADRAELGLSGLADAARAKEGKAP